MYPEVFVLYKDNSKKVYLRENSIWNEVDHDPWFFVDTIPKFKSTKHEKMFDRLIKTIDYIDVDLLVFNEQTWRYDIKKKAIRLTTFHPYDVRRLTKLLEKYSIHHALSNIKYIARCSLDLISKVFGYKVPLILHYEQDELEQILLDIYEKSRNLKIAVIDIEVESKGSFPRLGDKVLLAGLTISDLTNEDPEVIILEGEDIYKLIDEVLSKQVDYIVGFNAVGFDLPYYQVYTNDNRIVIGGQQAGIVNDSTIAPLIDLYLFAKSYGASLELKSHTSRSLDRVAKDLKLISKKEEELEKSIDRNNIAREYRENRGRLLKYLETDVRLTFRIARKWLPVLILLHALTAVSPYAQQWLPSMGSLAEYALAEYLLRKHKLALEVRSREWDYGEYKEGFIPWLSEGHKVISIEGVYTNILQLDYDMLYPTIAYEYKVDPTSVNIHEEGFPVILYRKFKTKTNSRSKKEKIVDKKILKVSFNGGPVHKFFSYAYNIRRITKKIKKTRKIDEPDSAAKVLANSVYGIFSKSRGSGLNEVVSAFIFLKANQILNSTQRYVEQVLGRKVVYGDTDSLFILLNDEDESSKIEAEINRFIKLFGRGFSIKLEAVHKKLAVYSAKNYFCQTMKDEIIIKGIHRYAMPHILKENLEEIIRRALNGENPETVISNYLTRAEKIEDLFVYTVKSLDELYNFDEKRFKQSTHPVTRAVLLSYLTSIVGYTPRNNNQVLNGVAKDIVVTFEDISSNIILSAFWLAKSSDTVCILSEPLKPKLLCGRFTSSPKASERELVQPVVLWAEEVGKEKIIEMALRTSQTLIQTLSKIYSYVKRGGAGQ